MTWDYPGPKPSFKFPFLQLVTCQRNLGNLSLCNYVLKELWVITMVKCTRYPIYKFANTEDRHPSVPGQNIFQYLTSLDIQNIVSLNNVKISISLSLTITLL